MHYDGANWTNFWRSVYFSQNVTNIVEPEPVKFTVYPNPVVDRLTVESDFVISQVIIYGYDGKIAASFQVNDVNAKLQIGHLPAGMYILTVVAENQYSCSYPFVKI
jgi:hypothetical protein